VRLTAATVAREHEWVRARAPALAAGINDVRGRLAAAFETDVGTVTEAQVASEVDAVFADGDRAVNVAAYVGLLRDLDVDGDYPGFVVDERLGRALAATVAGGDPLGLLAEATFHVADVSVEPAGWVAPEGTDAAEDPDAATGEAGSEADHPAGTDDLYAALVAGLQTRLPGWSWRETASPFG
jgi:hypothetical protein